MSARAVRRWVVPGTFAVIVSILAPPGPAVADGFLTDKGPYIQLEAGAPPGSSLLPIISVGETVGAYAFQGIPDGIGVAPGPDGSVYAFLNHEESHVPFSGKADYQDASVSQLQLDLGMAGVLSGSVAIPPSEGFLRFCSSFMAGPDQGFDNYTYFTNEETNDVVPVPEGAPYGPDPSLDPNRQAGYGVRLDVGSGSHGQIAGMGRMNHENTMVVPGGWDEFALLTTDDTFSAPASQLYLYTAETESEIVWAFQGTRKNGKKVKATDPHNGANDYGNIAVGDLLEGRFIAVPTKVAKGLTDLKPQDALESWSNAKNAFQFIRLEDLTYDRTNPRVVYMADTGEARALPDEVGTGRLIRGPSGTQGPFPNGRVFRMEFSPDDPRQVTSFTILLDNDSGGYNNPNVMHQPDNMDASENSLMVQEDTGQAPPSRIWRYEFATQEWTVVASVHDPFDDPLVNEQNWESSGIVDVSEWFGDGEWLLDVQAHDRFIKSEVDPNGVLLKQEDGQLLLMFLPGTT